MVKEYFKTRVDAAIEDILQEFQSEIGVTDGGAEPGLVLALDALTEEISDTLCEIIRSQVRHDCD